MKKTINCLQCGASFIPECKHQEKLELCKEDYIQFIAEEIKLASELRSKLRK